MRIISQPDAKAWRTEIVCKECKAELEIELSDITCKPQLVPQGEFGPSKLYFVSCEACGETVYLTEETIPSEFLYLLKRGFL